jgi:hypothetical protein
MIFSNIFWPPFAKLNMWSAVRSFFELHLEHQGCICLANLLNLFHSWSYFLFLSLRLGSLDCIALRHCLHVPPLAKIPQYRHGDRNLCIPPPSLLYFIIINIIYFTLFTLMVPLVIVLILNHGSHMSIE